MQSELTLKNAKPVSSFDPLYHFDCIQPLFRGGKIMSFRRGQKVEVYRRSEDEIWEDYMDEYIGLHGIITDPDTSINDPNDLVEVSLQDKGTHRLPQDCLRPLE